MPDAQPWEQWEGRSVVGSDGQRVGRISQIYLDQETGRPTWGSVHTGLFGASQAFVPLQGGRWQGEAFRVPYPAQLCKDAPHFAEDQELTHADQRRLHEHYGMSGAAASDSGAGATTQTSQSAPATEAPGGSTASVATDAVVTRSEERVRVGVQRTPRESVRLRKTVVTEPVSRTVKVRHEQVRVVREPISRTNFSEPVDGLQLNEEVQEVTLMQEEPVLEKTVVPVERVRLNKTVTEEKRQVRGELRREQIEVDRQPHE
ncbi:MAG: PRC and DUF2382 domain-containing protein [Candidatus Dormibacteria bacterium]